MTKGASRLHRAFFRLKPSKEGLVSGAIGGITGIIGTLLVSGLLGRVSDVRAGDVLQFSGAILGTGLAVAGALWLEERKRKAQIADTAQPVLDALLGLERKSRPFFYSSKKREELAQPMRDAMLFLKRTISLSPPRTAQLIGLFDRIEEGAALLTSELFLMMNDQAPHSFCTERHRVEQMLESFDTPLKLLIVEYSRLVDPKAVRSVAHLQMPEI